MKRIFIFFILLMPFFYSLGNSLVECEEKNIVINEIMFNPSKVNDCYGEWFELHNPSSSDIDIINWTFCDSKNDKFEIVDHLVVPSKGYLLLGRCGDPALNGGLKVEYVYKGMYLKNTSDSIMIYNDVGELVDKVEYDIKNDFLSSPGHSIELCSPDMDNNIGRNWSGCIWTYGDGDFGTPCEKNSNYIQNRLATRIPINAFRIIFNNRLNNRINQVGNYIKEAKSENLCDQIILNEYELLHHQLKIGDFLRAERLLEILEDRIIGLETHEEEICNKNVLFCENKSQYYDHTKAERLFLLLEDMGFDVDILDHGHLEHSNLEHVSLLIITNPQEHFSKDELAAMEMYLESGGKLILTGQYYKYLVPSIINAISSPHGIVFTETEVMDETYNTGEIYYPLINRFENEILVGKNIEEVHYANGCALHVEHGLSILSCMDTAYVVDPDGNLCENLPPTVIAISNDKGILCISSSTILTTSLFRGDNEELIEALIEYLIEKQDQ